MNVWRYVVVALLCTLFHQAVGQNVRNVDAESNTKDPLQLANIEGAKQGLAKQSTPQRPSIKIQTDESILSSSCLPHNCPPDSWISFSVEEDPRLGLDATPRDFEIGTTNSQSQDCVGSPSIRFSEFHCSVESPRVYKCGAANGELTSRYKMDELPPQKAISGRTLYLQFERDNLEYKMKVKVGEETCSKKKTESPEEGVDEDASDQMAMKEKETNSISKTRYVFKPGLKLVESKFHAKNSKQIFKSYPNEDIVKLRRFENLGNKKSDFANMDDDNMSNVVQTFAEKLQNTEAKKLKMKAEDFGYRVPDEIKSRSKLVVYLPNETKKPQMKTSAELPNKEAKRYEMEEFEYRVFNEMKSSSKLVGNLPNDMKRPQMKTNEPSKQVMFPNEMARGQKLAANPVNIKIWYVEDEELRHREMFNNDIGGLRELTVNLPSMDAGTRRANELGYGVMSSGQREPAANPQNTMIRQSDIQIRLPDETSDRQKLVQRESKIRQGPGYRRELSEKTVANQPNGLSRQFAVVKLSTKNELGKSTTMLPQNRFQVPELSKDFVDEASEVENDSATWVKSGKNLSEYSPKLSSEVEDITTKVSRITNPLAAKPPNETRTVGEMLPESLNFIPQLSTILSKNDSLVSQESTILTANEMHVLSLAPSSKNDNLVSPPSTDLPGNGVDVPPLANILSKNDSLVSQPSTDLSGNGVDVPPLSTNLSKNDSLVSQTSTILPLNVGYVNELTTKPEEKKTDIIDLQISPLDNESIERKSIENESIDNESLDNVSKELLKSMFSELDKLDIDTSEVFEYPPTSLEADVSLKTEINFPIPNLTLELETLLSAANDAVPSGGQANLVNENEELFPTSDIGFELGVGLLRALGNEGLLV